MKLAAVRRLHRLVRACADRGDDPNCWGGRLLAGVCRLTGTDRAALIFPKQDRLIATPPWTPAETRRGRTAQRWQAELIARGRRVAAQLEPAPGRAAAVAAPPTCGNHAATANGGGGTHGDRSWRVPDAPPVVGVAWRDRASRTACLLIAPPADAADDPADRPAPASPRRLPPVRVRSGARAPSHDRSPAGPGRLGRGEPARRRRPGEPDQRALRLLAVELSRLNTRLTHPGERCPSELSKRAREVLHGLLRGQVEKEVAARLRVTPGAVHKQVHRVYRHFGVNSRAELLSRWLRRGWGRRCDWLEEPQPATRRPPPN